LRTAVATLMVLSIIFVPPSVIAALSKPAREVCIAKRPETAPQRIGYELIDLMRREAWVTTDWTLDDFEDFTPPITALNWFKNEPRVGSASRASVLRSPGCEQDGQFTFTYRYGRFFFHIADITGAGWRHGPNGEISEARVQKHHRLEFDAGQTVAILVAPWGDQFVNVNRPIWVSATAPSVPEGWELRDRTLDESWRVDLFGETRVLRLQDGSSFQGPLGVGW
jgi:hypothetical protein